jgi:hypothetical protein
MGFGVGISTVFEIFEHFCFRGMELPRNVMNHQIRNKNMQDLRVGISTVFEILEHFLFQGDGTTTHGHDLHTTRCPPT